MSPVHSAVQLHMSGAVQVLLYAYIGSHNKLQDANKGMSHEDRRIHLAIAGNFCMHQLQITTIVA